MLRHEELAFIKAISTPQFSPALLRVLRMALSRSNKRPVVAAGSRSTTSTGGARDSQRSSGQLAGKRKANELATSGESFETANRRTGGYFTNLSGQKSILEKLTEIEHKVS
jgi:hypothetical protein